MQFSIPCATFVRLGSAVLSAQPAEVAPAYYRSIYLEHKNGKTFALITNIKFSAIELIGSTNEPDGNICIKCDPEYIDQCRKEIQYGGMVNIVYVDALKFATLKTTYGFAPSGNVAVAEPPNVSPSCRTNNWRNWFPDAMPTTSRGCMYMHADTVNTLAKSSPSGHIVFPAHINVERPVIVRDLENANWAGLFMPSPAETNAHASIVAQYPDWVRPA